MSGSDPSNSPLDDLQARIDAAKGKEAQTSQVEDGHSQAQLAWRMVIELVAGLAIGFGIGYGLDWLFGTTPIFLVLFIGFGFAAGVNVMMRTAKEVQEKTAGAGIGQDLPDVEDEEDA
ncbi:MAG: AtpZ/AtpI family protein [Pseudomonadota bacterium]